MSWIAMTDLTKPLFNIRGIGVAPDTPGARPAMQADEILPRGSMMLELRCNMTPGNSKKILIFRRRRDWVRELHLVLDGDGELRIMVRQGDARSHAALKIPAPERDSRLRITYAWDAPMRRGLLTVEMLDDGRLFQTIVNAPVPLPAEDVRVLVRNGKRTAIAPGVSFLAFADEVEPVGFGTGVLAGTPIDTPDGPIAVERLQLGDMVTTAASGPQPVRWIGRRTVPALGSFRPVRLRKPYFGLQSDVVVTPDHRVRLDLAEAEYMLGTDEVLLSAAHLANGKHAWTEARTRLVTYYQVLLDVHDCLCHNGLWAETLFVGTIARRPDVARTTILGDMPVTAIPEHRSFSHHRLKECEARSLAAALGNA